MLTYKELMTSSAYIKSKDVILGHNKDNPTIAERSKAVSVDITSIKKTVKGGKTYLELNCRGRAITDKVYYDLTILFYAGSKQVKGPGGNKILQFEPVTEYIPTWVRCTCPYFMYYCEKVLDDNGSTTLKYSDGTNPHILNKDQIPHVCKHLYRGLPLALDAAKKVARS